MMEKLYLNANDEAEFVVSESFSNDSTSFESVMIDIISQVINSKNFLSDYCLNEGFELESVQVDRCYHLHGKRKGV